MSLRVWEGSVTCGSHAVIWMPGVSSSCEDDRDAHLSAGALRVYCILLLWCLVGGMARWHGSWLSQSLHFLIHHQFIPQMKVYNLQYFMPRYLDLITGLSKMSAVYWNEIPESSRASYGILIIFLLVHSSRETHISEQTTQCHSKQDFEVSELV